MTKERDYSKIEHMGIDADTVFKDAVILGYRTSMGMFASDTCNEEELFILKNKLLNLVMSVELDKELIPARCWNMIEDAYYICCLVTQWLDESEDWEQCLDNIEDFLGKLKLERNINAQAIIESRELT